MRGTLFSAKAEYACIAMLELATRFDQPHPIRLRDIAEAHGIDCERFLVQILLQLKGAGLVSSTRGASGGYNLARSPDLITLADIIKVIDPIEAQEDNPAESSMTTPLVRTIRAVGSEVLHAQQRILAETTLAELLSRSQSGFDLVYQI